MSWKISIFLGSLSQPKLFTVIVFNPLSPFKRSFFCPRLGAKWLYIKAPEESMRTWKRAWEVHNVQVIWFDLRLSRLFCPGLPGHSTKNDVWRLNILGAGFWTRRQSFGDIVVLRLEPILALSMCTVCTVCSQHMLYSPEVTISWYVDLK